MTPELEFAIGTVKQAGVLAMSYFRQPIAIRHKAENHPVTEADLAVDDFLRERFHRRFPEDRWLSEESADEEGPTPRQRLWIVDPIDGTHEFIQGIAQFSISIALVRNRRPWVAVVYNPGTTDLFTAEYGGGAFRNGKPIRVSNKPGLQDCRMVASRRETDLLRRFSHGPATAVGSIAYKMALIASGEADLVLSLVSKAAWDVCAGDLLVREAGGRSTDGNGEDLSFANPEPRIRGIVAANPTVHSAALAWIKAIDVQKT